MLQMKLPRELRNMIYRYLTTYDEVEIKKKGHTFPSFHKGASFGQERLKFYTAKRLGQDTLYELAENFYRTSAFLVHYEYGNLIQFLKTKHLDLDIIPAYHVSAVRFIISTQVTHYSGVLTGDLKQLKEALQSLYTVRSGANLHFAFTTTFAEWASHQPFKLRNKLHHLAEGMAPIFPTLQDLKSAGYNVTIQVNKNDISCDGSDFSIQALLEDYKAQQEAKEVESDEEDGTSEDVGDEEEESDNEDDEDDADMDEGEEQGL
jgi:hypothetical protein